MFATTTITYKFSKNLLERLGSELKNILVLFLIFLVIQGIQGQQASMAEDDVIAKAEKLYKAKNYQEALPLYAQLVSVHSENPEYNYKFGVCTLYGNRVEHRRPIRYLENAAKSMGNDPELHYHLGIAYYQNQEFANAMKYLNLYLAKLAPNSQERPVILEKVNCCLNGLTLEHVNLVNEVVSTSEFQKDNFHRAYRADELDGMLILKPDAFVSSKEKSDSENSFVFISEPRGTLFYSGYENSNSDQRDIFKVQMTKNGEWGKPEKVSETINSMFDEAYPVLTNYGTTLYFCSKGHNSVGGYDIFKSTFDTTNNTFSAPENLGLGINSPFDDILFIPDKTSQFAFFTSDRDNLNESINVYRIQLIDNAFGTDHVLANNDFGSKLNIPEPTQKTSTEKSMEVEPQLPKETVEIASNQEKELSPSEKAQKMVQEKSLSNNMIDSAFLLVAETKSLVRSLTNKRDRANSISERKGEAAKNLEVSFDQVVSNLAYITSETEFESELQKAIEIRDEIFQYRYRADHANLIAWNIGKQIKIKNTELEVLKKNAGSVQSASISSDFEETQNNYGDFIKYYVVADTLTDYNNLIVSLTNDEIFAKTPATELAFADELREGFKTNTLLAMTQKQQKQVSNEPIPINVVDNRSNVIASNTINPVKLAEAVDYSETELLASINTEDENIEINFNADAIEAIKQVETILFADAGSNFIIDEELELNFNTDMVKPFQVVEAINYEASAFASSMDNEELEISFFSDQIQPKELITPVVFNEIAYATDIVKEQLEINFLMDQVTPENMISPIYFDELAYATEMAYEKVEINFSSDQVEAIELVNPVLFSEMTYAIEIDENIDINSEVDAAEALKLVEPVIYNFIAANIEIEENELEITSGVDFVQPEEVIGQIKFNDESYALHIDDTPEIRFDIDHIETLPIVEQITFEDENIDLIADNELEINIENDIDITPVAESVFIAENKLEDFTIEEDLDIQFVTDQVEALALVKPVYLSQTDLTPEFEIEDIEINIDVIQPIDFTLAQNEDLIFEDDLEINIENDVEFSPVVESVHIAENKLEDITIEEDLDIQFVTDQVEALALVKPVYLSQTDLTPEFEIEDIEINIDVIQPIDFTLAQNEDLIFEDDLEINFSNDQTVAQKLVEPVELGAIETEEFVTEDYLEINLSIDHINAYNLVEPIEYTFTDLEDFNIEDDLEVIFTNDATAAIELIEPIYIKEFAFNSGIETEDLELNVEFGAETELIEQVIAITHNESSDLLTQITETELEINFSTDAIDKAVEVVKPVYASFSTFTFSENEELEIRFTSDTPLNASALALVQTISFEEEPVNIIELMESEVVINFNIDKSEETLLADNTPSRLEANKISQIPSLKSELFYLRQSMSIATDIETSHTDFEILNIALNSPFDLSYEELLFAASLAQDPNDKLFIYNQAFIHINRDWRAFNNAAVIAMTNTDLEMAEVFLYQASLISEDNGKIENNMGILACYKNDFNQAEDHFIAANEMGVNSEYNLQLMKDLYTSEKSRTADLKQEMGESRYYEMLGDIMNYGTKK